MKNILKKIIIILLVQVVIYLIMFVFFTDGFYDGPSRGLAGFEVPYIFLTIYYEMLGKHIVPVVLSFLITLKYKINPLYWVFTAPILWGLIMLYCPEGAYDFPIPSLPGYHRFTPFWQQAAQLCFRFMILECIISFCIVYKEKIKRVLAKLFYF